MSALKTSTIVINTIRTLGEMNFGIHNTDLCDRADLA